MEEVIIETPDTELAGLVTLPDNPLGAVVFAHGSGSSRLSPRNQAVADVLSEAGLGTLLFDLLTPAEAQDRRNVFDIVLLAQRLREATDWLGDKLVGPVGYFGASTGAAAALVAAADAADVAAVVSRGGRPDLAGEHLSKVTAPTLLLVGSRDLQVINLNNMAMEEMTAEVELEIVSGAGHLFEEPGTLDEVAELARNWFVRHFQP